MDALRRPSPLPGDFGDPRLLAVAGLDELLVPLPQLLDALGQHLATLLDLVLLQRLLGVDQQQAQVVAEVETLPAPGPHEVRHLEPGHAAGPGDEAPGRVILVVLVPHGQARLLEQVVGVVEIAHQRVDVLRRSGPGANAAAPRSPRLGGVRRPSRWVIRGRARSVRGRGIRHRAILGGPSEASGTSPRPAPTEETRPIPLQCISSVRRVLSPEIFEGVAERSWLRKVDLRDLRRDSSAVTPVDMSLGRPSSRRRARRSSGS